MGNSIKVQTLYQGGTFFYSNFTLLYLDLNVSSPYTKGIQTLVSYLRLVKFG